MIIGAFVAVLFVVALSGYNVGFFFPCACVCDRNCTKLYFSYHHSNYPNFISSIAFHCRFSLYSCIEIRNSSHKKIECKYLHSLEKRIWNFVKYR